jgi:hypothetical protein
MISEASLLDLRTRDPDVGATVALWLSDELQEAHARGSVTRLIVVDDGLLGPPLRRARHGRADSPARVMKFPDGTLEVRVSSSLLFLERRASIEALRSIANLLFPARDTTSIDQFDLIARQRTVLDPCRAVLKPARRPCRFLLRVDDFPSPRARLDDFIRFDAIAKEHDIPYLLAVTPFTDGAGGRSGIPDEACSLLRSRGPRVSCALHGFTHASRYANYGSELAFLSPAQLSHALAEADAFLGDRGLTPRAFVAPFNAYDPHTLAILASRYAVLCGGPESVASVGYRVGPSVFLGSLYVPSYRFAYDVTLSELTRLDELIVKSPDIVIPITVHWHNEAGTDFPGFRALCRRLQGRTEHWDDLIARMNWVRKASHTASVVGEPSADRARVGTPT